MKPSASKEVAILLLGLRVILALVAVLNGDNLVLLIGVLVE